MKEIKINITHTDLVVMSYYITSSDRNAVKNSVAQIIQNFIEKNHKGYEIFTVKEDIDLILRTINGFGSVDVNVVIKEIDYHVDAMLHMIDNTETIKAESKYNIELLTRLRVKSN